MQITSSLIISWIGLTQRIYIWRIGALRFANTPYR